MKNACKHLALCTLTLILCLALAACGSDDSGDSADYGNDSTVPSTIDGFVKESYDSYDYSAFEGYYLPDSGTDFDYLIIDTNGSRWRIGSNDDLAASGYLQYDADYDCIYAYNEHDGVAYQFSADGGSVSRRKASSVSTHANSSSRIFLLFSIFNPPQHKHAFSPASPCQYPIRAANPQRWQNVLCFFQQ